MLYETYKLGKLKKSPVQRFYTREELESYELPRLKEICRAESIKPPSVETFYNKQKMVALLYKYLGTVKKDMITLYSEKGCIFLKEALKKDGARQPADTSVPVHMEIYKGQDSLGDEEPPYIVISQDTLPGVYSFLADGTGNIQAILEAKPAGAQKYRLYLSRERMSPDIPAGYFHNWSLVFFKQEDMEEAVRRYLGKEKRKSTLRYSICPLPEVLVKEVPESEEPLVIDYGTSYTTAGIYKGMDKAGRIFFTYNPECGWESSGCQNCSMCPSVVAVKDCSRGEEDVVLLFGEDAVQESKRQGLLARSSIFYNTSHWAAHYRERISVTDQEGNTCEIERLFIVRQFLLYIIGKAEQQTRMKYTKICFICPVKQKGLFLDMYKSALPGYHVSAEDEAVAALYQLLGQDIRDMSYEDGVLKNALVLDCGGGTSEMTVCRYRITDEKITSKLDLHVAFVHGDTSFGGNNLTWRILQFLKIRIAEAISGKTPVPIHKLFPGVFPGFYEAVDMYGTEKVYETFTKAYQEAEAVIPTFFALYHNKPENFFLKVRGNYYFLWNLAEAVKQRLFGSPGICWLPLGTLFGNPGSRPCFTDFHISVQGKDGTLETNTICPELVIGKEEANLLLKPDIYGFLKNFIEPWYESGKLSETDRIILSGQSSKTGLFKDVLKEYVAGRKANPPAGSSCAGKLMSIDGAVLYRQDKNTGRIRASLEYEPARVPYSLAADDYNAGGREKILLEKGSLAGQVYGWISRPVEAAEVLFRLKDGTGKEVSSIPFLLHKKNYKETGYDELRADYQLINQEDLDSIKNNELRIFVFADNANWGFSILEISRKQDGLYSCPLSFIPFEAGAWETDFFDGRH
ncbi:MAG: hypothetical protein K1W39_01570 [Lachnospiraceae bacterium]|jgi:hypothetical protein